MEDLGKRTDIAEDVRQQWQKHFESELSALDRIPSVQDAREFVKLKREEIEADVARNRAQIDIDQSLRHMLRLGYVAEYWMGIEHFLPSWATSVYETSLELCPSIQVPR